MKTLEQIGELVRGVRSERTTFRPCAFFDERLDCIRVTARDCSVLEERLNDRVTILVDNYYPQRAKSTEAKSTEYVGFTIKGATHFCKEHGLAPARSIALVKVLDALLASSSSDLVVRMFVNLIAKPLIEKENIEQVEIPEGYLQPA